MTTAERRAKLTRLRAQVDDLYDSIHVLYAGSEAGTPLEIELEVAKDDALKLAASLGRARDALSKGRPA